MESGEQACRPGSLNTIPVQSPAFKEGRAGRGERPETSRVHAAGEMAG